MNRDQLEQALNTYADAKNRHDLDAIIASCAPDCYYEGVGFGPRVQGIEALRAFYGSLFRALPDYYGTFDGVAFGEDSAVVWGHFGGTLRDSFMGFPVEAGRTLKIPVTFVCTFRDGKLLSDVGYFNAQTLLDQAGLAPSNANSIDADAAADFVARFKSFWVRPTGARSAELIHKDAKVYWPGITMSGTDLIGYFDNLFKAIPSLKLEVSAHAHAGDNLFIAWRAEASSDGRVHNWNGVDRFVLKDGMAIEEHVVFDMASVREALGTAA